MSNKRKPRQQELRNTDERPSDSWLPASILPTPADQDGYVFRWIRTSTLNKSDNTNVSQKFREGWIPVRAEDHPELQVMSDFDSRFEGNVEVGGLLLCKAPAELMAKRAAHYEEAAAKQMDSVDNSFMRENDPRMPLLSPERKTRTTFGSS